MARSDKKAKRGALAVIGKSAADAKQPGGCFEHSPVFYFRRYDASVPWSDPTDGKPTVDHLFNILRGFEGLPWREIVQANGSRSHGTNSHYIRVAELSPEARRRANVIRLEEDQLFDLHLEGDARFWGVIEPDGAFYVIWYDPNHLVLPVRKK